MDAAGFDSFAGTKGAAADVHFVTGYEVNYDSVEGSDSALVALFQFATPQDAASLVTGFSQGSQLKTQADPAIPGGQVYDSTTADNSGTYQHGVVASKGDTVMIVNYATDTATRPPLVDSLAEQQYTNIG
jgi:hypothetical protein